VLNKRPIFINAFSRGGSNILWNIFLSHPDVCSPIIETLEIFRIGLYGKWPGYKVIMLSGQPKLFNQKYLEPRRPLNARTQEYIDGMLYEWKLKTAVDDEMCFKYEDERYTLDEVKEARLCAKTMGWHS
jgi:hypothetical protein